VNKRRWDKSGSTSSMFSRRLDAHGDHELIDGRTSL
jgi:hypothetical protein